MYTKQDTLQDNTVSRLYHCTLTATILALQLAKGLGNSKGVLLQQLQPFIYKNKKTYGNIEKIERIIG